MSWQNQLHNDPSDRTFGPSITYDVGGEPKNKSSAWTRSKGKYIEGYIVGLVIAIKHGGSTSGPPGGLARRIHLTTRETQERNFTMRLALQATNT